MIYVTVTCTTCLYRRRIRPGRTVNLHMLSSRDGTASPHTHGAIPIHRPPSCDSVLLHCLFLVQFPQAFERIPRSESLPKYWAFGLYGTSPKLTNPFPGTFFHSFGTRQSHSIKNFATGDNVFY